jgi:NAD(P)-dependent dehydrogenase (short-subunit alcohol dehydrogenase family)
VSGRLAGKVAIVAGAGASGPIVGNGQATAILFAREGAKVVCADLIAERAQATVESIAKEGGTAVAIRADVSKATDCQAMVRAAVERFGRLDILHNNVGISVRADVLEVSEEQWDRVMATNVKSIVLASKYAIPEMIKAGGGSIINVSSTEGFVGAAGMTAYAASKFGVRGMTKCAALELGQYGIRVNSVHPGVIRTPMSDSVDPSKTSGTAPLGRLGEPVEVANLIVYLASDESSYTTGAEHVVDGGTTAGRK